MSDMKLKEKLGVATAVQYSGMWPRWRGWARLRWAALLLACLGLSACQGWLAPAAVNSEPYYAVPVGSQLILNRRLVVTDDDDRIHFQDGRVLPYRLVNIARKYDPNCVLIVRAVGEYNHVISPDTFTIRRVRLLDDYAVMASAAPLLADGGGLSYQDYATVMYLHSPRQPQVDRLVCKHYQDPTDGAFLSLSQIREALGDIFTLKPAAGS